MTTTITKPTESPLATLAGDSLGVTMLPVGQLQANDYNPNRMSGDEYTELVAEVRHLGRLPKPVVVRLNGDGYVIVDGEHGWRAARDVGLEEVPVEVIEVDDFEAMRQTYKRNQHGRHNPVLEGRMFRRMMAERGLSQRALAKEMEVSEGSVRNALTYAEAAEVRNGYAPDTAAEDIAGLTVNQVRCYVKLPEQVRDIWVGKGKADLGALWTPVFHGDFDSRAGARDVVVPYVRMAEDGLLDYLSPTGIWNAKTFRRAIEKLQKWDTDCHAFRGLEIKLVRWYMRHFYLGGKMACWGRDPHHDYDEKPTHWVDGFMDLIIEPPVNEKGMRVKDASFRLSPEEFDTLVDEFVEEGGGGFDFEKSIKVAVALKTGTVPEHGAELRASVALRRLEMEAGAPAYIAEADVHLDDKCALWKFEAPDDVKQRVIAEIVSEQEKMYESQRAVHERMGLAKMFDIKCEKMLLPTHDILERLASVKQFTGVQEALTAEPTGEAYADVIAGVLFNESEDRDRIKTKLRATFEKEELAALFEAIKDGRHQQQLVARFRALSQVVGGA